MTLWNQLAALFLPTRRLVNDAQGRMVPGGVFGGRRWVVARGDCQYRREDLRALPVRRRLQAARLAAIRHRPVPTALTYVAWTGGVAHFWFWDAPPELRADMEGRWVPETLLLPPSPVDGVRLVELVRGVEGQFWQGGELTGSQWWSEVPGDEAWLRFVRAAGLDPAGVAAPKPVRPTWSARPWGEVSLAQRLAGVFEERLAWLLLFSALAAGLGWQLASLYRWQEAGEQLAARVERVRTTVNPLLAAREQAETAQSELVRLQALRPLADDYRLMAGVARHLPTGGVLLSWQREAGKLQVQLRSEQTDPRAFVAAFEGDPELSDVAVTPVGDGIMRLAFELPVTAKAGTQESGNE